MDVRWLKRGLIALAMISWFAQWIIAIGNPRGDFLLHWEFGRRLSAGEFLYEGGMDVPYPPVWSVPHVPLSWMSPHIAKPIVHVVGLGALVALFWVLTDLARRAWPLRPGQTFWTIAAALVITSRFVTRDFDDGGQNLILLALVWGGLWLFTRGRWLPGGASLGLAVALKCTAGIFVLYFLLKRQWTMAASSVVWAGLFFLTPLFWQTPAEFLRATLTWKETVLRGMLQPNPSVGVLGPEPLQNRSLRPALARFLMHLPAGYPGRTNADDLPEGDPQRWSVEFLDLAPVTAGGIIKIAMALGLCATIWCMRKPLAADAPVFLWEAAIVSVIALLYSPITWGQHCVAVLPAIYLLVHGVVAQRTSSRGTRAFLIGFAIMLLLLNRSFIGKDLSLLMESYHVVTFALVGLVGVMFLTKPRDHQASPVEREDDLTTETLQARPAA